MRKRYAGGDDVLVSRSGLQAIQLGLRLIQSGASLLDLESRSVLVEHASCWTGPPPIAADVTGLLHQSIVEPWGERLMAPPGGQPYRVPPDDRPEEALAAEIVAAGPTEEVAPGDTEADLLSFAAAVARAWPSAEPHRDRMWSPGPVPSSYFT